MEEWKIGEIRQVNGEWYQCVVAIDGCSECSFRAQYYCELHSECSSDVRSDGISVIFKKLEKVGEPYIIGNKLIQRYKMYPTTYHINVDGWYYHNLDIKSWTIDIEIKQNKEDMEDLDKIKVRDYTKVEELNVMEEKKLNLKPFDLEAAKAGKQVCTRDGRKARIICFDRINGDYYKIVACVTAFDGDFEEVLFYGIDGYIVDSQNPKDEDLMMLPEKKEGWVNVYKRENEYICENECCVFTGIAVFKSEGEAKRNINKNKIYVNTIKISWEG